MRKRIGEEEEGGRCSFPSVLQDESATFIESHQSTSCLSRTTKHFVKLLQKCKGCIKSPDGTLVASIDDHSLVTLNGEKFGQTVRVAKCELLTKFNVAKCDSCKNYHPTL